MVSLSPPHVSPPAPSPQAGLQLGHINPYKAVCDTIGVKAVTKGAHRASGVATGAAGFVLGDSVDKASKALFLLGSFLLLGVMAASGEQAAKGGEGTRGAEPASLSPRMVTRPPPSSYSPSLPTAEVGACSVCLTNARDTVLEDCQHLVLCWQCYEGLHDQKCPACQSHITAATFTYRP